MKYSMLAPVIAAVALAACNRPEVVAPPAPVVVTTPAPAAAPEPSTTIVQVRPDRDHDRNDHDRAPDPNYRDDRNDRK
jgi:hypothetical protein